MKRLWLAFVCFFRVLLGRPLPAGVAVEGAPPAAPPEPPPEPPPDRGAVAVLALLHRAGRLVDFLLEDIDGYDDAQVGAAVRDVHRGCRKALFEHIAFEAVLPDREGGEVTVEEGFDASEIRLTGAVSGTPPFTGRLRHPGWRVKKLDLPNAANGIVAPAEVEL